MPDSKELREKLAEKGQMGCPKTLNYPLDTEAHLRSAINYYSHKDTIKCQGFWPRACRAAKRLNVTTPKLEEKCKL